LRKKRIDSECKIRVETVHRYIANMLERGFRMADDSTL
jgi:hypothetical protein